MGTSGQDAADHPAAGGSRSHFQEIAHAVGIGCFDGLGEIDAFQRLGQDGLGSVAAVHRVGAARGSAVETYAVGGSGAEEVQVTIGAGDRARDFAMHGGHALQREKPAVEHGHQMLHPLDVAADDALFGSVDDQQVDPRGLLQSTAHLARGNVDHADAPVDFLPLALAPGAPRGPAFAGQIPGKKGGGLHAREHQVTLPPGARGKESGRFPQAVTDHGTGLDPEALHHVADRAAGGYLSEDHGQVVVVDRLDGSAVPELFGLKLVAQLQVFRILAPVDLRPERRKLHAHAGVVVTRARVDKADLAAPSHGVLGEEQPVAKGRMQKRLGLAGSGGDQLLALSAERHQLFVIARHHRNRQRLETGRVLTA